MRTEWISKRKEKQKRFVSSWFRNRGISCPAGLQPLPPLFFSISINVRFSLVFKELDELLQILHANAMTGVADKDRVALHAKFLPETGFVGQR